MAVMQSVDWRTSPAWKTYRHAFENFREQVHAVQSLGASHAPKETLDAAVIKLQIAVEEYRIARDVLLHEMIPSEDRANATQDDIAHPERVKEIAELLWELEGRPDDSALDDWYRAEAILRRSSSAIV